MGIPAKKKIFGAVTVGERGQVVIPADIRRSLNVNPGDKLIIFSKHDMISLVHAEQFDKFLNQASKMVAKLKK